jgi:tetraacyldisaccharide 4'-kinase
MEQWYKRIISGEDAGLAAALLRPPLSVAAWFYGLVIWQRNRWYDRGVLKVQRLNVPVISVGNITTGGTGKTPTVIMLTRALKDMGRRPVILTRGYRAPRGGLSDEVMMLSVECPDVPVVVNADRVEGGRQAIERHKADVLILDDGFQHRRLGRNMDIVLIDATSPMGIPGMIPRGTQREPPAALTRANQIMLTRCEQVSPELADMAAGLLAQWISPRNIFQQRTRVTGFFDAAGNRVILPKSGATVIAFAGIGNPDAFVSTLGGSGLNVAAGCWFDDHHQYDSVRDVKTILETAQRHGVDAGVTTLKDWVKIKNFSFPMPIWHVKIESYIDGVGGELWRHALAELF